LDLGCGCHADATKRLVFRLIDKEMGRISHIAKAAETVVRARRIHIERGVMVRAKLPFDMMY
jgi:hypothetical protein